MNHQKDVISRQADGRTDGLTDRLQQAVENASDNSFTKSSPPENLEFCDFQLEFARAHRGEDMSSTFPTMH